MTSSNGLKLGTTIYSFTNAFHARKYTVEQLMDKVGELGIGPGVEIVGFSHIREFPKVTDKFAESFQAAIERNQLVPTCLGLNADVYRRRDRPMTEDESYEYHKPQIEAAARLGFPVARCQMVAGPEVLRRLAPLAERLNVKLGMELHAPETVDSPTVLAFREMMAKENSPYLGFIPDFSSSARAVPSCFINHFRETGIPEKYLQIGLEAWKVEGTFPKRQAEYQKREKEAGAPESVIRGMFFMFAMLGRIDRRPGGNWCRRQCISTANVLSLTMRGMKFPFRTKRYCRYLSKPVTTGTCLPSGRVMPSLTTMDLPRWSRNTR